MNNQRLNANGPGSLEVGPEPSSLAPQTELEKMYAVMRDEKDDMDLGEDDEEMDSDEDEDDDDIEEDLLDNGDGEEEVPMFEQNEDSGNEGHA